MAVVREWIGRISKVCEEEKKGIKEIKKNHRDAEFSEVDKR
jgi:hypothetical protein